MDYVKKYADHVVLLDQTVVKQGSVKEVFESPEFANVFGAEEETWIHGKNVKQDKVWMEGGNEND